MWRKAKCGNRLLRAAIAVLGQKGNPHGPDAPNHKWVGQRWPLKDGSIPSTPAHVFV